MSPESKRPARAGFGTPAAARRALLGLGVPVYCELLSGVVAGIIDTLWVARLGAAAVGAVAVASTLENVLLGVILMAGTGATILIAEALGAGRRGVVPVVVRAVALLWLALSFLVAVGGFLLRDRVATLLVGGGGGDVHRLAVGFLAVSFPGMAVFFAQNVVDGLFKGTGDTRTPMRMALLANGCVLVLDPLLIYGVGGLPRLGVQGAALATLAGRAVALAVSLLLLRRVLGRVRGDQGAATGPGVAAVLRRVLRIGLPVSGDFVLRMGMSAALVGVVAGFGAGPLAAYGIGAKVMLLVTMACYAFRQAAAILTARTWARTRAGGPSAARLIGRQSLLLASTAAFGAGLLLALGGHRVMRLFTIDPALADAGAVFFRYLLPYLVLLAGVVALGGVFTGAGRTRALFTVTALGACVPIPLAYGLSATWLGVQGVWLSMVLATGAQYGVTWVFFRRLTGEGAPDGDGARDAGGVEGAGETGGRRGAGAEGAVDVHKW
ncbi:MATE family efflux transporter [Streptomyces bauhiniae]|uniref:Probable multidrug resistance protein NorM n=1 Tax=Streptomyces bauhiniae TaxID=2340725 RepID=A0A4Z1D0D4_9ACTN|nr:MATE family efflux transporter [Streptomyces bauhiniae]TGN74660.1 MATE family efflux transporter [Streptomyces bauhiniae]